jgi:DNA-binding beta-propeller fold protein YncE
MRVRALKRVALGAFCLIAVAVAAAPAQAVEFDEPLFLLRPKAIPKKLASPPPASTFENPCGVTVDGTGAVYVSDYYHNTIDVFGSDITSSNDEGTKKYRYGYLSQFEDIDPVGGPCGLALDASGTVYYNEYHRSVVKNGTGVITGAPLTGAGPTGLAIDQVTERLFVDDRDHITVFDLGGTELGQIGSGSLLDGYGLAVSRYSETLGLIYVPDAATKTVKVYEPTPGGVTPVAEIDGSETPLGHFVSLADSAVAVDNVTGEVYVMDNLQPASTEKPEAVVYVFDFEGKYEGRLKYSVIFGRPNGLAVDNSGTENQSRVYVTSGNTESAALYGYPPHAATSEAFPLPEPRQLAIEEEEEQEEEPENQITPSVAPATLSASGGSSAIAAPAEVVPPAPSARKRRAGRVKGTPRRHRNKHRQHRAKRAQR